ncbi:MAG: lipopolysaccharide biosynthesis protein [Gammaproteobacteria bacterium]
MSSDKQHSVGAIARGSIVLVAARVLGMLCGLMLMIFLARTLTPDQLGVVTLCFSTALLGGLVFTLNVGAGAVRFINTYLGLGERGRAGSYLVYSEKLVLKVSLAVLLLLGASVALGRATFVPTLPVAIASGLLVAPMFAWLRVEAANVAAAGAVVRASLPATLFRPALMLITVMSVYLATDRMTSTRVLVLYGVSLLIVVALQHFLFRSLVTPLRHEAAAIADADRRSWRQVGVDLLIPTLFLELSVDIIVIIAALVLPTSDIAALGIVLRIQGMILFGVTSINMIVSPKIAAAHSDGDRRSVNHLLFVAAHLKLWPAIGAFIMMAVLGQWVLGFFGPEYREHLLPLLILCGTPILMALIGPVVLFVTVLGLEKQARRVFQVSIGLLLVLIVVLGKLFGLSGVATGVMIVWCVWQGALHVIVRRSSGYSTIRLTPAAD